MSGGPALKYFYMIHTGGRVWKALRAMVDGQLPPALNVQNPTSGKHHQARLALSRVEVKASEPSVIAAMKKVKEKERTSNILRKL